MQKRLMGNVGSVALAVIFAVTPTLAQQPPAASAPAQAPSAAATKTFSQQDLDQLLAPIALYPDPLLSQVLAAATFSNQIPEAARWADQHH